VQGEPGTAVTESDDIHPDHVTDDLVDTWSDGQSAGVAFGIGVSLSYNSVLPPASLPLTCSRRVTFAGLALSCLQVQGVLDAVSTPQYVSPTPAPPASIPTHLVTGGPVPHASASGVSELPTRGRHECNDAVPVKIGNDRPRTPHLDTTYLDEVIHRQRVSSTYSPLSPSTTCAQASPESLTCPLVMPTELTQVTDLLVLFAGVVSTTPVVVSIWSTLCTTPSSDKGVLVVPRVGVVVPLTPQLSHALGGPASPSTNMSVLAPVTTPLAKSSCGNG